MKTLAEKIAVMQAAAEGKVIEVKYDNRWRNCNTPYWNWFISDYRVKPPEPPKPREIYLNEYPNQPLCWCGVYLSSSDADAGQSSINKRIRCAKFREVIEE